MIAALETRAEIAKLARLLGTEAASLDFLCKAEAGDLRKLREQATDRLYDADRARLERAAAASKLLPTQVVATIGHKVFGALLCARIAGMLEPARAVDVAKRLPADFLADIAAEIDPRRASDVIARIPTDQIVEAAKLLAERGEVVAMGRFVGHLSPTAIAACIAALDEATILRVAFVLEDKDRLDDIVELLSDDRLRAMIRAAAKEKLWPEALDLTTHLAQSHRAHLADITALEKPTVLRSLIAAAHEEDLWAVLVRLTAEARDERAERRIAETLFSLDAEVLRRAVEEVATLPVSQRRRIVERARDVDALERLAPDLRQALEA